MADLAPLVPPGDTLAIYLDYQVEGLWPPKSRGTTWDLHCLYSAAQEPRSGVEVGWGGGGGLSSPNPFTRGWAGGAGNLGRYL